MSQLSNFTCCWETQIIVFFLSIVLLVVAVSGESLEKNGTGSKKKKTDAQFLSQRDICILWEHTRSQLLVRKVISAWQLQRPLYCPSRDATTRQWPKGDGDVLLLRWCTVPFACALWRPTKVRGRARRQIIITPNSRLKSWTACRKKRKKTKRRMRQRVIIISPHLARHQYFMFNTTIIVVVMRSLHTYFRLMMR